MSKKMLMKTINNIYFALVSKYKTEEIPEDFLEFLYTEFEHKNSSKKVVERKIYDLLNSLAKNQNLLKSRNFLKFLEFSEKINEKPFSCTKDSLFIYISGLDSIFKSKIGIMSEFSEFSENFFIPTLRLVEFFRVFFSELFPAQRLSKMIEFVEKHSTTDKKRLNKGVIEMENGLNYAVAQFEEHFLAVRKTGMLLLKTLNSENALGLIKKNDLIFLAGLLKPGKIFKELEGISSEFLDVEDVFATGLREIFPEEVLDFTLFDKIKNK